MNSIGSLTQGFAEQLGVEVKKPMTDAEAERQAIQMMLNIARISNGQWGDLDKVDGYNCPKCKNKGYRFGVFRPDPAKYSIRVPFTRTVECECMEKRRGYQRSRMSGLPEGLSLENFYPKTDWAREMKEKAQRYIDGKEWKEGTWFYVGGAVGSGKTHITTALARELVYHKDVVYFEWIRDGRKLKATVNDDFIYTTEIYKYVECDILFIDDFLRGYMTDGDKRLAYDLLNDRYINKLPTLITSELYLSEISDEAISSRIFERAGDFVITVNRDGKKNERYNA